MAPRSILFILVLAATLRTAAAAEDPSLEPGRFELKTDVLGNELILSKNKEVDTLSIVLNASRVSGNGRGHQGTVSGKVKVIGSTSQEAVLVAGKCLMVITSLSEDKIRVSTNINSESDCGNEAEVNLGTGVILDGSYNRTK